MNTSETGKDSGWQKTPYANLVRYKSSGMYFARFRVKGKLIRCSLKTTQISVAKLRLGDLEKQERQRAEHQTAVAGGTMTFADAFGDFTSNAWQGWFLEAAQQGFPARPDRGSAQIMAKFGENDTRKISKSDCHGLGG